MLAYVAIAATVVAGAARVASVWDRLPARMATHFGVSGRADGWSGRSEFFWTYGVIFAFVMSLLFAMPLLVKHLPPDVVNVPNREYWLSPARRDLTIARMRTWSAWLAALTAVLLACVLELTLRANLTGDPLDSRWLIGCVIGYAVGVSVSIVALFRAFRLPGK